ncbi:MAG: SIMPL domain-containing protein [Solirubrobacteraceae bacterium]
MADRERDREKAAAYAAGVDSQLGPLLSLVEPDDMNRFGRRTLALASSAGGRDMPVKTGDQEVTATIQATFALRQLA